MLCVPLFFSFGSPVATGVNASPLTQYQGGIVNDTKLYHMMVNHVVSIVGWGTDPDTQRQYWIVRNSWGQYWGEMSYFRILLGKNALGIESQVAWATPGMFTIPATENAAQRDGCTEGDEDKDGSADSSGPPSPPSSTMVYVDPSHDPTALQQQRRRHHLLLRTTPVAMAQ